MIKRVISGIVIGVVAVGSLLLGGVVLNLLLMAVSIVGCIELQEALGVYIRGKKSIGTILSIGGVVLLYVVLLLNQGNDRWMYVVLLIVGLFLISMAVYVISFPKISYKNITAILFSFIYAPLLLSFIYCTWVDFEKGKYIAGLVVISAWISDTAAYFVGTAMGRHKLAPVLSPKKSIEGSAGAVIVTAMAGLIYGFVLNRLGIFEAGIIPVFGIICGVGSIISQLGDLTASAVKRQVEIKDFGWIIPGHGGIMDRFDSIIVTAPVIYWMAVWLVR